MRLNLPILDTLADHNSQNILIAGAGGGFDIFAGLPLYFTLREMGKRVHLANFSFSEIQMVCLFEDVETLIPQQLIGAHGLVKHKTPYYPEGFLAEWFCTERDEEITIWMFAKLGVAPLMAAYQLLIERLNIDAIILVDGGVDSLMRGDEDQPGTLLEDTISLAAVEGLKVPVKLLACLGFGAETEVAHYHALHNMAELVKQGAFRGSCALIQTMPVFQLYEAACQYVWKQPGHIQSHISTRVIAAVQGNFGDHRLEEDMANVAALVSPLMSLYWFFDAVSVFQRSLIADKLRTSETIRDALQIMGLYRSHFQIRRRQKLPY